MSRAAPTIACLDGEPVPDRHAERISSDMVSYLCRERMRLHERAIGLIDIEKMGSPAGQKRIADRLATALGPLALEISLKPAKRARFVLEVVDWLVWDSVDDDPVVTDAARPRAWLGVALTHYTGARHRSDTKFGIPLLVSHHAITRLAQRAGVRTIDDLLESLRELWCVTSGIILQQRDDWLAPPQGSWFLPLSRGQIAVLTPARNGGKRLVVKTILDAVMAAGFDPVQNGGPR